MSESPVPGLPPVDVPTLLVAGTFALYQDPDGGIHLSYRRNGTDEDEHLNAPPALLRMMQGLAGEGGGPFAAFRGMLHMRRASRAAQ